MRNKGSGYTVDFSAVIKIITKAGNFSVESSSESTSRETTPESEASDEEADDNDDDEEEVAQQDDDEENLPDIETVPAKPIVHRDTAQLAEDYAKFFQEYSTPDVSELVI